MPAIHDISILIPNGAAVWKKALECKNVLSYSEMCGGFFSIDMQT